MLSSINFKEIWKLIINKKSRIANYGSKCIERCLSYKSLEGKTLLLIKILRIQEFYCIIKKIYDFLIYSYTFVHHLDKKISNKSSNVTADGNTIKTVLVI